MGTPWPAARPDPLTRARRLHADLGHAITVAEHTSGPDADRALDWLDDLHAPPLPTALAARTLEDTR